MGKFDALNEEEKATFSIELVTLSGVQNCEAEEGTSIASFKEAHGLSKDTKIVDEDGDVLTNTDEIVADMTLYVSAPKKNG